MTNLKTCVFVALLLSVVLASPVFAKGVPGVVNGIHNLSTTGIDPFDLSPSKYRTDEDQVCVFCHTPHGGSLDGPLWNRSQPPSDSFTHYNSSTLSNHITGLGASRDVNVESLLCMSCHDGSISVNHLLNVPNDRVTPIRTWNGQADTTIVDQFTTPGSRIGGSLDNLAGTGDLSDDHPISFSYQAVYDEYQLDPAKAADLRDVATATGWLGEGVRFFGTDVRVECSSCHDPHVDYISDPTYKPFLIRSNAGSNLCLACHNK